MLGLLIETEMHFIIVALLFLLLLFILTNSISFELGKFANLLETDLIIINFIIIWHK